MLAGILVVTIGAVGLFAGAESYGAMIGRLFELRLYGRVIGSMSFFSVTAAATAPVASGWLFDWTGTYRGAFLVLAVLLAVPLAYASLLRAGHDAGETR